jgi:hypothetical protein
MVGALAVALSPDEHWRPDWSAVGAFVVAAGAWLTSTLRGAVPAAHPSDTRLFEEIEEALSHDERQFLRGHDFINDFERERVGGVRRIYDAWDGPRHKFIDPKLQARWKAVRETLDAFVLNMVTHTSPARGRLEFQTVRYSRGDGVTQREHDEAASLNKDAEALTKALDSFEELARRRLRR